MSGLSDEHMQELHEIFEKYDKESNGLIDNDDVGYACKDAGHPQPGYKLRRTVQELDKDGDGHINFDEFAQLIAEIASAKDMGYTKAVKTTGGVQQFGGTSDQSVEGTVHSTTDAEKVGFVDWINYSLGADEDLKANGIMPIDDKDDGLFRSCHDGIMLAKLINTAVPETIDERALNKKNLTIFTITENQTLVINSAKAVGCNIVNIGPQDLVDGVPHLCLGLIWQIIRLGLLTKVNLNFCPGLVRLLEGDETLDDLMALPAEQILLRWMNFHLREAGSSRQVHNFSSDIKDSEAYVVLLKQIAPRELGVDDSALKISDTLKRAETMLGNADKMGCRRFVQPRDVTNGNAKLNLAFVANLFNTYPALEIIEEVEIPELPSTETREEKTFRNWMNSLGVEPYVNNLYQDLRDGTVLLELFNKVYPGSVDDKRVNRPPYKKIGGNMKKLENTNYAIELGQRFKFSLVGIGGKDILDGHPTYTLALVWQLMRAYTLEVLKQISQSSKPIADKDIVDWVNHTLTEGGKSSTITSFKDQSISSSLAVIDLVDCIKPNSINYGNVISNPSSDKDKLLNAKYAISMARKIGAGVYALPEDLVEVNSKMAMTVFACLMAASFGKQ